MLGEEMGYESPAAEAAEPAESEESPSSIFLSKATLGGKTVKVGDTLSLSIKSVDPETGDAEAAIEVAGGDMGAEGGYEAAFDEAMPPEPEM